MQLSGWSWHHNLQREPCDKSCSHSDVTPSGSLTQDPMLVLFFLHSRSLLKLFLGGEICSVCRVHLELCLKGSASNRQSGPICGVPSNHCQTISCLPLHSSLSASFMGGGGSFFGLAASILASELVCPPVTSRLHNFFFVSVHVKTMVSQQQFHRKFWQSP